MQNNSTMPTSAVFLGTSGWGQKVSKTEAYRILELFYANNFRWVDTATNYPIDEKPENYGQTIEWLAEFCRDFPELKIYCKVGSANNIGDSTQLINSSYLALIFELLYDRFDRSLGGVGIHWDSEDRKSDRSEIINHFKDLYGNGFAIGLSGVQQTENYTSSSIGKNLPWILQTNISPVKESKVTSEIELTRNTFPNGKIYGYNIFGGIKASGIPKQAERLTFLSQLVHKNSNTNDELQILMDYMVSLKIDGIIVGPTTLVQCQSWCTILDRIARE